MWFTYYKKIKWLVQIFNQTLIFEQIEFSQQVIKIYIGCYVNICLRKIQESQDKKANGLNSSLNWHCKKLTECILVVEISDM